MASHTAWLQHSFVWARAEVFSMGTDTGGEARRRGQDPGMLWVGGQVEVTGGMLPGPLGRSPVLTLHPSSSYVLARVPFHQLPKDLSGTRLHHSSVKGGDSVFNLQTSVAGYSGTSLVFTLYVADTCEL